MAIRTHKDWLEFLKKAADLPIGYSIDDLIYFQRVAERQYPTLAPLVKACINFAQEAHGYVDFEGPEPKGRSRGGVAIIDGFAGTHIDRNKELEYLLRNVRLFPRNADLVRLAQKLMPDIYEYRFDKMSRGEIAKHVIAHMDKLPPKSRYRLEAALRDAVASPPEDTPSSPSFLTRWENIIKDMEI